MPRFILDLKRPVLRRAKYHCLFVSQMDRTRQASFSAGAASTLSTLNGVSDGLDVRSQGASSLCTEAACNISLQVGRSEGVTPGSTINEVHVISLCG